MGLQIIEQKLGVKSHQLLHRAFTPFQSKSRAPNVTLSHTDRYFWFLAFLSPFCEVQCKFKVFKSEERCQHMTKHALCRKKSQHLKGRKKRYGYIIAMLSLEEWKNMGLNQHQLLASQRKIPELELNEFLFNEYKTLWKTLLLYETTFTLQMHFCASFHKPKTSSDTKFTHLWQPKPEQTFRKKRSTKVTNCFFSPPPVSR